METAMQAQPPGQNTPPPRPPAPRSSQDSQAQNGDQETTAVFSTFQELYDKAYAVVQKGLDADEDENTAEAEHFYTNSLLLLNDILQIDCECWQDATPSEMIAVKNMQQKVNKTKLQLTYRLEALRGGNQLNGYCDTDLGEEMNAQVRLPSYEEAVSECTSLSPTEQPSLASGQRVSTEGTELFSIPDGVQIYYITNEGYVSAPSYPTSLHIVRVEEPSDEIQESYEDGLPPAFLQVGDWLFPLIPGASPILHTTYGAYLFPDLTPDKSGSSVGLILPNTLAQEEKHALEDILRNLSSVKEQQTATWRDDIASSASESDPIAADPGNEEQQIEGGCNQSTSGTISRGIIIASQWISWGLRKGADKAGELITYGSTKLRDRLHPDDQPKHVDPCLQKGAMYARKATNTAVCVSAFIVTKLGKATVALGRTVAPHVRSKGGQLIPNSMKTEENKSKMDGVLKVATSSLVGVGTVFMGLEAAAKSLGRSIAKETVATVQHKYGEHAEKLAEDTVYTAGNVAMTAYTAESLAAKAIAKRAARDTGMAVMDEIRIEEGDHDRRTDVNMNGTRCNDCEKPDNEKEKEKTCL